MKHMSTVVKIKKNDTKTGNPSQYELIPKGSRAFPLEGGPMGGGHPIVLGGGGEGVAFAGCISHFRVNTEVSYSRYSFTLI